MTSTSTMQFSMPFVFTIASTTIEPVKPKTVCKRTKVLPIMRRKWMYLQEGPDPKEAVRQQRDLKEGQEMYI
jgi:hypothetical protein